MESSGFILNQLESGRISLNLVESAGICWNQVASGSFSLYLKFLKLRPLGREVMKSAVALLHHQLCGVQLLLERLGAGLKVLHLRQKVLAGNNHSEKVLTGQNETVLESWRVCTHSPGDWPPCCEGWT